jgi:hypothetical protein
MCADKCDISQPPAGFIPIRDYFDALMKMTQRAVEMAREDMERRMAGFPDQFVKRGDIVEILSKLTLKVEVLEQFKNQMDGKATERSVEIVRWVAITGIILSIMGIILRFFKV